MQDTLNAIHYCGNIIHSDDCSPEEFDKVSDQILQLIAGVIRKCLNKIDLARKVLAAEGLDVYLDVYLDLNLD